MHKLKNKHTGEVITTPYLSEAEEYLKSGDYKMEKPVYTKEMHDRGELPVEGMIFLMGELDSDSRCHDFSGVECKVVSVGEIYNYTAITFHNIMKGVGSVIYNKSRILPIPTIEDELIKFLRETPHLHPEARARKMLELYNITPKEK